jgi:hypothetical protein
MQPQFATSTPKYFYTGQAFLVFIAASWGVPIVRILSLDAFESLHYVLRGMASTLVTDEYSNREISRN